ncbi:MAG TPA: PfkB family carbohydrate kinase [Gaiellaceae bacterium]
MTVAVIGHVEWIQFARVERVPSPGEIVHASEAWEEPGGGGAVAAVQLARLAGSCLFITALGEDELGHRAEAELDRLGVRVAAAWRPEPQRKAFVYVDADGERTITVIGERRGPRGDEPLPWDELADADAVYFTAGDSGALRAARAARILVASVRAKEVLASAGVQLDVLVASGKDRGEQYVPGDIEPVPGLVVSTAGGEGGTLLKPDGTTRRWVSAPLPGRVVDAYGAGDSFAAGLTFGLGAGRSIEDALALAARCGAACMTGRGPYEGQLRFAGAPKP